MSVLCYYVALLLVEMSLVLLALLCLTECDCTFSYIEKQEALMTSRLKLLFKDEALELLILEIFQDQPFLRKNLFSP